MTKNIAKYAFKSGILPKPRRTVPRVNAPFEQQALDSIPVGFKDPKMVPKGSSANPPGKIEKSAAEKIAHSAKEPTRTRPNNTKEQEWKALSAKIRRVYLTDALNAEEKLEAKRAEKRQDLHLEGKKHREALDKVEDSQATKLTLPSIDQSLLLDGPMVQARTPEETRKLELQRKTNLLTTRLEQAKLRDHSLLALYQNAHNYIVTEEELNNAVDQAFSTPPATNRRISELTINVTGASVNVNLSSAASSYTDLDNKLVSALTGTIAGANYRPGLEEVRDVLGENREWLQKPIEETTETTSGETTSGQL